MKNEVQTIQAVWPVLPLWLRLYIRIVVYRKSLQIKYDQFCYLWACRQLSQERSPRRPREPLNQEQSK